MLVSVIGYGLLMLVAARSLRGEGTTNIAEYRQARDKLYTVYPWSPKFLPPSIPVSAQVIEFQAATKGWGQGHPYLLLEVKLSAEDAEAERARLDGFPCERDGGMYYFVSPDSLTRQASVHCDKYANTFQYALSSD